VRAFFAALGRGLVSAARASALGVARAVRAAWRAARFVLHSRPVRVAAAIVLACVRLSLWTALFAGLLLGAGWLLLQRVPAGFVGVRQGNFGGGIEAADYPSGVYFAPRGLVQWHLVERKTNVLDFAWESEGGDFAPLEVRTKDGNVCHVGLSVLYRVKDGEANALVRDGLRSAYHQRVKATVEKVVLQEFGNLSSGDFASTETRLARCAATLPVLNGLLAGYHVEAERLLVTQFLFAIEYEKKLQEKQLTEQEKLMASAQQEVETQREINTALETDIQATEKRIRSEMDLVIQQRFSDGRKRIVELNTEAKEYDRRRKVEAQAEYDRLVAEGDRILAQAEGLKETLENQLWDSSGGRMLLARKAAENLNIKQVTLNSNDPRVPSVLDLDEMVRLLLGRSAPRP
jgi:hypothetical protein